MVTVKPLGIVAFAWAVGYSLAAMAVQLGVPSGWMAYQCVREVPDGVVISSCCGDARLELRVDGRGSLTIKGRKSYMAIWDPTAEEVVYPTLIHDDTGMLPMPEWYEDTVTISGGQRILFAVKIEGEDEKSRITDDDFFYTMGPWIDGRVVEDEEEQDAAWSRLLAYAHVGVLRVEERDAGAAGIKLVVEKAETRSLQRSQYLVRSGHIVSRYLSVNGIDFVDIIESPHKPGRFGFCGSKGAQVVLHRTRMTGLERVRLEEWSFDAGAPPKLSVSLDPGDVIVVKLAIEPMAAAKQALESVLTGQERSTEGHHLFWMIVQPLASD